MALLVAAPTATALPANIFELDGNTVDAAGGGDDWDTLFAGLGSSTAFTGVIPDLAGQTIFVTGGSKDDLDVSSWRHTAGSVPDKDEITNAYAAAYLAPDGPDQGSALDLILYFGSDRFAQNGTANVGFWFTQQTVAPIAGGLFSGAHETGDTLVLSEFTNGGAVSTIQVWEWDPDAIGVTCPSNVTTADEGCVDNEGNLVLELASGNADCDSAAILSNACANVNSAPITVPWGYLAKGNNAVDHVVPTGGFIEGGVNLSALRGGTQPCLSNFLAETRSSASIDAQLKDFVRGDFELCEADISIAPDDVNDVGETHTFTVHVSSVFGGQPSPVEGNNPTVTLTDANGNPITPTEDTCATTGTDANGDCTVTFTSNVATVVTGHAETTVDIGGQLIDVETGDAVGQNPDAVKVFVDGRVSISPDDVNGIGESHTFTVTATQKIGDAADFTAATDGHAEVRLTDADGAVNEIDAAASTCDDAGDNLDAAGQCTITFTSNTTGTVTGHARVAMNLTTSEGPITIFRRTDGTGGSTGDAVKEFVDGSLAWLKNDDTGARLGGATFEVCRTHTLDTSTSPDTFIDSADVCVTVLDNSPPDANPADGEFLLEDLELGRYTVDEVPPFPPGFEPDPDVVTVELTLEPGPKDVTISEAFVNRALFRLIVVTCNTTTEELVDSTVTLGDDTRETVKPGELGDINENALCQLPGANYDNLTRGTYNPSVELPDLPPLFPAP